jgi:CTP:molybdopterin cytidylyltransferase MocA
MISGSRIQTIGDGRECVRLELEEQGRDLVLRITGGVAHVGAVALAAAGAEAPVRTLVLPPHKEGPLAAEAAAALARATGRTCVVVAGIHQDDATPAEIGRIVENVREGVARLCGEGGY